MLLERGRLAIAQRPHVHHLRIDRQAPLLLGRGVNVPMPVVLIGALGGMVSNGIIGLFIGPVILAVAYQVFWQWVKDQPPAPGLEEQRPL